MKNPNWNKHETALLIELYFNIEEGTVEKTQGCEQLSMTLQKCQHDNIHLISDNYRNVNGIRRQLTLLTRAFNGEGSSDHRAKIFDDMIQLYHDDYGTFAAILEEAHVMFADKKISEEER